MTFLVQREAEHNLQMHFKAQKCKNGHKKKVSAAPEYKQTKDKTKCEQYFFRGHAADASIDKEILFVAK